MHVGHEQKIISRLKITVLYQRIQIHEQKENHQPEFGSRKKKTLDEIDLWVKTAAIFAWLKTFSTHKKKPFLKPN